jgi:hypothetical protein
MLSWSSCASGHAASSLLRCCGMSSCGGCVVHLMFCWLPVRSFDGLLSCLSDSLWGPVVAMRPVAP